MTAAFADDAEEALPVCGFKEGIHSAIGRQAGWKYRQVDIFIRSILPGFTLSQMRDALAHVQIWNDVCGIDLQFTDDINRTRKGQIIIVDVGRIDGSSGTLAWSELPNIGTSRIKQMYDRSERFVNLMKPQQGQIGLPHVACHEFGHAIGISHINGIPALLNPTYKASVHSPLPADIRVAQSLYGLPTKTTVPVPSVPSPGDKPVAEKTLIEIIKPLILDMLSKIPEDDIATFLMPYLEKLLAGKPVALMFVKWALPQLIKALKGSKQQQQEVLALVAPETDIDQIA